MVTSSVNTAVSDGGIPTILGNRRLSVNKNQLYGVRNDERVPALQTVQRSTVRCASTSRRRVLRCVPLHRTDSAETLASDRKAPSLYVLNAASLAKPHAVEQLAADLISYSADIAVITETHFKVKHMDAVMNIPEFTMCRRDRQRRRRGGVAVYVRFSLAPACYLDLSC